MKFTPFLLALFLVNTGFSQEIFQKTKTDNLKGNPKSISLVTNVLNKRTGRFTPKYHQNLHYHPDGNIASIEYLSVDGNVISKDEYVYKNRKLAAIITYTSRGTISKKTTYQYDRKGLLTAEKKYNNKGVLQFDTRYLYNAKGQLTTSQKLIPSINYTVKMTYKYDSRNRIIESTKTGRIGTTKETYSYTDTGLLLQKSEYNTLGEKYTYTVYSYNDKHDKISLKKYDGTDTLTYYEDYKYRYDKKHNWIEKTSFEKGKKTGIEKRKIVYR